MTGGKTRPTTHMERRTGPPRLTLTRTLYAHERNSAWSKYCPVVRRVLVEQQKGTLQKEPASGHVVDHSV